MTLSAGGGLEFRSFLLKANILDIVTFTGFPSYSTKSLVIPAALAGITGGDRFRWQMAAGLGTSSWRGQESVLARDPTTGRMVPSSRSVEGVTLDIPVECTFLYSPNQNFAVGARLRADFLPWAPDYAANREKYSASFVMHLGKW